MLERAVWTDADFDTMGWHDATVYAIAFPVAECRDLLLDLDYIVRWVDPEPPDRHFTFWVAPATLVFHGIRALTGEVDADSDLEIADIHRVDEHGWEIEGHNFELKFTAAGFHQHFRARPVSTGASQNLGDARGPVSFARPPAFG